MALSCMVGRPSSTVVPLTVRPISSPRILCSSVKPQISFNANNSCADAKKNLLRQKLVAALKSEMKTSEIIALQKAIPPVPADFPFTIKDFSYEHVSMKLTRELDEERIDVDVSISHHYRISGFYTGDRSLAESLADTAPYVYLTVDISKENRKQVSVGVYASSDDCRVTYLSVDEHAPDSDDTRHFGYYDVKDGSDLQLALREFVEMRGVEKKYAEFLFNYIVETYDRRPVVVLEKLENYFNE